jgi:Peptidase family M28
MKILIPILGLLLVQTVTAQQLPEIITATEVERIERVLAADDMQGRRTFTPGIEKAAAFIAGEFKAAGLKPVAGNSYLQSFSNIRAKFISVEAVSGDTPASSKDVIVITTKEDLQVTDQSGYEWKQVKAGENLFNIANEIMRSKKNTIVQVDRSFAGNFSRLTGFKRSLFSMDHSVIFILGEFNTNHFSIHAKHEITTQNMANVVGILPGKKKKDEYVIFSGHYDHLGIGKPKEGDSIFNGANDDAAGTTAVIMLAKYFSALGNNERTIIFAAFTAEEIGGFGSQYFSRQFEPASVMAMFNIEMIGTESKWGKNSAFITGFDKTDMGAILQKNLEGSGFSFYPDPYPEQQLFFRSDNATLAALGVPAHTISTSKMDTEKFYHTVDDEIETLDMENMAQIIRSIAISAKTIISGKDTPTRVDLSKLK